MGKYEDLLDRVEELDPEIAEELKSFSGSTLRKEAERVPDLERQLAERDTELKKLRDAPEKQKAFEAYGVDFASLRKAELLALENAEVPESGITEEWVAEIVTNLDLPVKQGEGEPPAAPPAAERIAKQATTADAQLRTGSEGAVLKPEDLKAVPIDKLQNFMREHPNEWEALKRGETVTGVTLPR